MRSWTHQQALLGEVHVLDIHQFGAQLRDERRVVGDLTRAAREGLDQIGQRASRQH
jgi:hypothetical protein